MKISIKDDKTGVIYSTDMSDDNRHSILSMNFCASYTDIEVQDEINTNGKLTYPTHTIILPPEGTTPPWVDTIATQGYNIGSWVQESWTVDKDSYDIGCTDGYEVGYKECEEENTAKGDEDNNSEGIETILEDIKKDLNRQSE